MYCLLHKFHKPFHFLIYTYCDREKTDLKILADLHVFSLFYHKKVISGILSMYVCLSSAWMVGGILFISGIDEFTHLRGVSGKYEDSI
jgi:hypothetical protein